MIWVIEVSKELSRNNFGLFSAKTRLKIRIYSWTSPKVSGTSEKAVCPYAEIWKALLL
jgi:hypothetical protein